MKKKLILCIMVAAFVLTLLPLVTCAQPRVRKGNEPPLDVSLMAFKDQGVWYFLCDAPAYPVRIGPHYLMYGPPPPYCPPPGGPPPAYPCKVR